MLNIYFYLKWLWKQKSLYFWIIEKFSENNLIKKMNWHKTCQQIGKVPIIHHKDEILTTI